MSSSMPPQDRRRFEGEYRVALQEFKAIRAEYSRIASCGRRFVLVPCVTQRLRQASPTCPGSYVNDLERLRVATYISRYSRPPQTFNITADRLEDHIAIFYTLLDLGRPHLLHHFANQHVDDKRLPLHRETILSAVERSIFKHEEPGDFYESFFRTQFEWCPVRFDLGMNGWYSDQIIPAYRRERINPRRDGPNTGTGIGNHARVWSVEIAEELVSEALQEKLPTARLVARDFTKEGRHCHDNNPGPRFRLALKTFPHNRREQFEDEDKIFRALVGCNGIIHYVGWYKTLDRDQMDAAGEQRASYTIVLELAQFDLYQVFREEAPPITPVEIQRYWAAMLDVAKALKEIHHDLKLDNLTWDVWHGDIKPENILRVDDCFKLADPGEARMKLANQTREPPTTSVPGGTRTYAAPEKSSFLDGHSDEPPLVDKSIDVWSLGCVISVAATFLVLGKEGVQQYDRIRRLSILRSSNTAGDAFHNGTQVLEAVTQWHEYLRLAARSTDTFTAPILGIVDRGMLQSADRRWNAKRLCTELEGLLDEPGFSALQESIPKAIEDMLQEIDLQEEIHYEQSAGIRRADSDEAEKRLPTAVRPSDEQLSGDKTKSELYAQRLLPTAQRTQGRTLTSQAGRGRRPSEGSVWTLGTSPHAASRTPTISGGLPHISGPRRTPTGSSEATQTPVENSAGAAVPSENQVQRSFLVPITIWDVQTELETNRKSLELPRLSNFRFSSIFRKKEASVRTNKQWQKEWIGREDPLQPFLDGRDIVYLVDNGSTMYYHWTQVSHWMRILVWRSLGYDDDGMELYFTNPDTKVTVPQSGEQTVKQFLDALRHAKPAKPGRHNLVQTNIEPMLIHIMNEYMMAKTSRTEPKKKTVIVLTDGAWEGMTDEKLMDNSLKGRLRTMMDNCSAFVNAQFFQKHGHEPSQEELKTAVISHLEDIRPITLQFVRFGHNERGIERLRRLDDDLKGDPAKPSFPDLVDTEPAEGDVYKMFSGSLFDALDRTTTVVSTIPSTASSLSPRSSLRGGQQQDGGRSRSNTLLSDDEMPMSPTNASTQPDSPGYQLVANSIILTEAGGIPGGREHRQSDGGREHRGRAGSSPTQASIYGQGGALPPPSSSAEPHQPFHPRNSQGSGQQHQVVTRFP